MHETQIATHSVTHAVRCAGAQYIESADCLSQGCCYVPAPGDIGGTYLELPACFLANEGASIYAVRGSTLQTEGVCCL